MCFSLKFCDFSELCQFCCIAGVLPAWCVYTHWRTKRKQSPEYFKIFEQNTISNEHPVCNNLCSEKNKNYYKSLAYLSLNKRSDIYRYLVRLSLCQIWVMKLACWKKRNENEHNFNFKILLKILLNIVQALNFCVVTIISFSLLSILSDFSLNLPTNLTK